MIWSNYQFCLPFLIEVNKIIHESRKNSSNNMDHCVDFWHNFSSSGIGPDTSFMYSNPEWVTYGIEIVAIRIISITIGIIIVKKINQP